MLVLARNINERIIIKAGETEIKVLICKIDKGHGVVKVGIDAPDDVQIYREEVLQKMQQEQQQ